MELQYRKATPDDAQRVCYIIRHVYYAEDMFFRLVKQLAEKEGVNEQLKAGNQMLWVMRMNNIRNRATEIVNTELIYT